MPDIISIDPGGARNGVCRWDQWGALLFKTAMSFEELYRHLTNLCQEKANISTFVVEDYRLRQGKQMAQTGSRFETVQMIGALRLAASLLGAEFVTQPSNILRIAAMHAGIELPKGHIPDALSAHLHGFYYLESVGVLEAKPLDEL